MVVAQTPPPTLRFADRLRGYLITMAYRYIGDAPSVPKSLKHSAGGTSELACGRLVKLLRSSEGVHLAGLEVWVKLKETTGGEFRVHTASIRLL